MTFRMDILGRYLHRLPPRIWAPLLLASACAAFAYLVAVRALQAAEQRLVQRHAIEGRERSVIVAARSLAAGMRLETAMLAQRRVPERYLPASALEPADLGAVRGALLLQPLGAGDVLVRAALGTAQAESLSAQLAAGERAITISVDDTASQAGLLQPGDRIDLLYVEPADPARDGLRVRPLLQAVTVLATGQELPRAAQPGPDGTARHDPGYSTLTLRLAPQDVQRLVLAQRVGEIIVSLRAGGDAGALPPGVLGSDALFGPQRRTGGRRNLASSPHIPGWIGGLGPRLQAQRWPVGSMTSAGAP